jgi:stress response protein SCP2
MAKFPLEHTVSGRERILVALSWDERAHATIIDKLKRQNQQHDLDLSCFVYNKNGEYIDFVGPMAQDNIDQDGCIYHSGDDAGGAGNLDDEHISVELAGLPFETVSLIFVAEIRSDHTFEQITNPSIRVADGFTNKNLHAMKLATDKEAEGKTACIFARVHRDKGSPTGWSLQIIDQYPKLDDVSDWGTYLTRYL